MVGEKLRAGSIKEKDSQILPRKKRIPMHKVDNSKMNPTINQMPLEGLKRSYL